VGVAALCLGVAAGATAKVPGPGSGAATGTATDATPNPNAQEPRSTPPGKSPGEHAPQATGDGDRQGPTSRLGPHRPNILLVFIDTVRADHVGLLGYARDTTPHIDAFFRDGVLFPRAYAAGPATRFSVAPMLTGKHYTEIDRHGVKWPRLDDDEVVLGQRLHALGYRTAAVHSIDYFRKAYNLHRGFDHWDDRCIIQGYRASKHKRTFGRICSWDRPTSDLVTDRTLAYVDESKLGQDGKPFFLWAYYSDPHGPYITHRGFPRFGPWYRDRYDNEIVFTDYHVGRLLDGLRARGLLDNTIVFLTADHGEALNEKKDHGILLHSATLYDDLVRVPLLVRGPGLKPRRVMTAVSLLDLLPTFVELAGGAHDPAFRGVSLVPYLRGQDPAHPAIFMEKHRREDMPQKAMVRWPYKLIVTGFRPRLKKAELYDLERDPAERHNLIRKVDRATRDALWSRYLRWVREELQVSPTNRLN